MAPGTDVHIMGRVHTAMIHPVASAPSLWPLMLLVLVSELYPDGFVDSIKLQISIESIDSALGHLTLPKLDKGASILCGIMVLLFDDINIGNVSVRREHLADETFICIPWQLPDK